MPIIGITGGVATGKSLATRLFSELGASVLSADAVAREVTAPGSPAAAAIAREFGSEALRPDGSLDRAWLGARVFRDDGARARLEAITHPPILASLRERMDAHVRERPGDLLVVEVPLLYEAGMAGWFDAVVVVACSEEAQLLRLMSRDGRTREEAASRVAAQMPLVEKARRADHVLWNDGTEADLRAQVAAVAAAVADEGAKR